MPDPDPRPLPCPACAGLVWDAPAHIEQHINWHLSTGTSGLTAAEQRAQWREVRDLVALADDEADDAGPPTAKLPPIRDTVRRRPPAADVRDLTGPELLRYLARALEADPDVDPAEARQLLEDNGECGVWVADPSGPYAPGWHCRRPASHRPVSLHGPAPLAGDQ